MSDTETAAGAHGAIEAFPDEDALLMRRVATGDEQALVSLIERWKGPLINFFYRSVSDFAEAEDLAQTVFIRLYRSAPRYEIRAKFSTYLFQIARRLLLNEYRRKKRHPIDFSDPAELHAIDTGLSDKQLREIEELFSYALQDLPENQRTAILLFQQQELTYEEIAQTMDASESAVKSWIFRAREHLRSKLKGMLQS